MSSAGSRQVTGWVGWIWFAAIIMVVNGGFNIIDGLVALFKKQVYVQGPHDLVVFNFTAWGWILLVIGAIQLIVAFALVRGSFWARVVAIGVAVWGAFAQLAFITAYPLWSVTVIALDVVVLWALTVHGDEAAAARDL